MVNIEEFSSRLKKVMEYYNFSASSFAEKLDIQRSSISHLLSGRNKPSLDFVLKVLKAFPEIELYWLLNGSGTFPKKEITNSSTTPLTNSEIHKSIKETNNESNLKIKTTDKIVSKDNFKEIERIVIFYSDGSFKNYTP